MFEPLLTFLTFGSILLVVYHHLVYPLLLRLIGRRRARPTAAFQSRHYGAGREDRELPSVSVVMPAFNEEAWIAAKIHNLAALDYPPEKLRIVLACDGCTDRTAQIAKACHELPECAHLQLEIHEYPHNRGKVAVINQVLKGIRSELVALSDISALVSVDALLVAAARFREQRIGVLNSHYRILHPGSDGEADYWNYQSRIKSSEAALGSTLGAHGAFYVFRRELFHELAPDTINDDFMLPMEIVAQGYRAEQDNRIMALELERADEQTDRQRRKRISAGNLQQLFRLKRMLLPRYGGVAFTFASGKGLRVLMPFAMLIALFGSLLLAGESRLFLLLAMAQLTGYAVAAWELIFRPAASNHISKTLAYIVSGHLAGLMGSLHYAFGRERQPWRRAAQTDIGISRETQA